MIQTISNGRKIANATASGERFYNTVTGSIVVENPEVISVEWVNERGDKATTVKYGVPVSLRVTTEDGSRCSIILAVQCDGWRQEYVSITKVAGESTTSYVSEEPEAPEETTITFTPDAEWLNPLSSASGDITATVYLVYNKDQFGQGDETLLRGFVEGFKGGSIGFREFWRFRAPVFFDFKEAETLPISTGRVPIATLSISQKGIDFIKSWEKLLLEAYDDAEHYATIGYGHLIWKYSIHDRPLSPQFANFADGITEEEAENLLKDDLSIAEETLKGRVTVDLYQHEYDAFIQHG